MSEENNNENILQNAILAKSEGDDSTDPIISFLETTSKSKYKMIIIKLYH
jgi:hypothetical protein